MTKNNQNIIDTASTAQARAAAFVTDATGLNPTNFKDKALRLALELVKYGEYIKTTLLLDNKTASVTRQTAVSSVDPKLLEGASDEEKAMVERTPPA